ncbi:MAG: hypothetical protein ACLPUT_13925 [Solirubrobacteraceae bacterium]
MFKVKPFIIGFIASGLIGALAPAAASASSLDLLICKDVGAGNGVFSSPDCQTMGGGDEYAWTKLVGSQTAGIAIAGGPVLLKGKIAGVAAEIECSSDATTGTTNVIEAGGASKGAIELKSCAVKSPEPTKCVVTISNIQFKGQVVTGLSEPELELAPASGTVFSEVTLSSKSGQTCVAKGTYAVKGTQNCKLPKAEESLVKHSVECTAGGSHLELAGNAASFANTQTIELTTGEHWKAE